jgi:uncharacterized protein (TIGR02996 family)
VDDEHFLRAIDADDESARLVYADWLEERGDPRAEYLRAGEMLRAIPLGDPRRCRPGQRWSELRNSLDREWIARMESRSPAPWWLPSEARHPARVGVRDFYRWMSRNHFEFVILAALAPIEAVARTLIECRARQEPDYFLSKNRWRRGVAVEPGRVGDPVSPLTPLVQLKGHAWTVAMYETFNLSLPVWQSAQADASELSYRLGTLAVEFSAEDTSSAEGYHLYECGEFLEFSEWTGPDGSFASKRRRRPAWDAFPSGYPDELFREIGLYLPGFYASDGRDYHCVAVDVSSPADVERADLLVLGLYFAQYRRDDLQSLRAEFPEIHTFGQQWSATDRVGDEGRDDIDEEDIPF